jgi:arylsulfatase A-like enzyme
MPPRLRFLLLALLGAWTGAAIEACDVAAVRPWTSPAFLRAAIELVVLWSVGGVALALLVAALARGRPLGGGWLIAPLAWSVAWLLGELDPRGQVDTLELAIAGLCAVVAAIVVHRLLAPRLARVRLLEHPLPWLVAIAAAGAFAVVRWRATTPRPGPPPAQGSANVLWISLDTLRADHVGAFGGPAGLTPTLDELSKEGVVFPDTTCPMPLTAPSHVAMLTGLMPHESGVHKNGVPLSRSVASLPRQLAEHGYVTAGFVSGFPLFDRSSHFASHFHHYDDEFDPSAPLSEGARMTPLGRVALRAMRFRRHWREPIERNGDKTVDRTIRWLETQGDGAGARPFFVFCHLYDVHAEYLPHEPGQKPSPFWDAESSIARLEILQDETERRRLADLYSGEVHFADAQVGRLLERLRARGLLERTLVVVTADHGESLGEHDYWYEHINPYHVETHVPLILRLPNHEKAGTRVAGPAQLTDLAATVRDLLGLSLDLPGSSLASAIESGRIPRRLICCQSMFDFTNAWYATSVRDGRFKLLRRSAAFERYDSKRTAATEQLFDLDADPGELTDLLANGAAAPADAKLDELRSRLDDYERICVEVGPDHMDPEVREALKRLGYGGN